jgi:surfeit locus 1 family protein
MIRRLPIAPTIVVLIAVGIMVRLGFWQIDRLHEKQALIAQAERAMAMNAEAPWPRDSRAVERSLYRHATVRCLRVIEHGAVSGQNLRGEPGWAHRARCALAGGGEAQVVLGWSRDASSRAWSGGEVSGVIAPGPRLVASVPVAGLEANATPNPRDLPNNHLSYAVQWFLFAVTALVIYGIAVRQRFKRTQT